MFRVTASLAAAEVLRDTSNDDEEELVRPIKFQIMERTPLLATTRHTSAHSIAVVAAKRVSPPPPPRQRRKQQQQPRQPQPQTQQPQPRVTLQPHQRAHFDALVERLFERPKVARGDGACGSFAPQGTGKTVIGAELVREWQERGPAYRVVLVCAPLLYVRVWRALLERAQCPRPLDAQLSYHSLQTGSARTRLMASGLLQYDDEGGRRVVTLTDAGRELFASPDHPVLVILDEAHEGANDDTTLRSAGLRAITHAVCDNPVGRLLLLSATPAVRERHARILLQLMGVVTSDDPECALRQVEHFAGVEAPAVGMPDERIFALFCRHLVSRVALTMLPPPRTDGLAPTFRHWVLRVAGKDAAALLRRYEEIATHTGGGSGGGLRLGEVDARLEWIKMSECARVIATQWYAAHASDKFVLGLRYVNMHGPKLITLFRQWGIPDAQIVFVSGASLSPAERAQALARFNEHNLDVRILVAGIQCLASGVDLDDQSPQGTFRRRVLCAANPLYVATEQFAGGRFFRACSTSAPLVAVVSVDGDDALCERHLLERLQQRAGVQRAVLDDETREHVGEYRVVYDLDTDV